MRKPLLLLLCAVTLAACAAPKPAVEAPQPAMRAWSGAALTDLQLEAAASRDHGMPAESAVLASMTALELRADSDPDAAAELDAKADALFARLAQRYAQGVVDPEAVDPEWRISPPPPPDLERLRADVAAGASPTGVLRMLLPQTEEYHTLARELARLNALSPAEREADHAMRIERLRTTLERWRWLPRTLATPRIEVRAPHFLLLLRQADGALEIHKVIVGARRTPTPAFAAQVETVTLNPTWTPPSSILLNELLPRLRRDPGAAAREGYDAIGRDGQVVADVDWRARPFPYAVRQRPGPRNALGQVRFDLPNPFAIYLHDTPSRSLFSREDRALSHGCVRVDAPLDLARALLTGEEFDSRLASGVTQTLRLERPVPIYVLYMTAMATPDGEIAYAEDIYRRDGAVLAALDAAPRAEHAAAATQRLSTSCVSG